MKSSLNHKKIIDPNLKIEFRAEEIEGYPYPILMPHGYGGLEYSIMKELMRYNYDGRGGSFKFKQGYDEDKIKNGFNFYDACFNELKKFYTFDAIFGADHNFDPVFYRFEGLINMYDERYLKDVDQRYSEDVDEIDLLRLKSIDEARYTIAKADMYHNLKDYYVTRYDIIISGKDGIDCVNKDDVDCVNNCVTACKEYMSNMMSDKISEYRLTSENQTRLKNDMTNIMQMVFEDRGSLNRIIDEMAEMKNDAIESFSLKHDRDGCVRFVEYQKFVWSIVQKLEDKSFYPYDADQMAKLKQQDDQNVQPNKNTGNSIRDKLRQIVEEENANEAEIHIEEEYE